MCQFNENPLFLQMNPEAVDSKELPICLYESELRVVNDVRIAFPVIGFILIVRSLAEPDDYVCACAVQSAGIRTGTRVSGPHRKPCPKRWLHFSK